MFEQNLIKICQSLISQIHTCMPGKIISFDREKQTAKIQPCLKIKLSELDEPSVLPVIMDAPVFFPSCSGFCLTYDVSPGDYCLILFSERSIGAWMQNGGVIDSSARTHDLSDAIVFCGIQPETDVFSPGVEADSMVLRSRDDATKIRIKSDNILLENANGTIELKSTGQVAINGSNLTVDP